MREVLLVPMASGRPGVGRIGPTLGSMLLVVAILLLTWVLRVAWLDAGSIWSDEGFSVYRTQQSVPFILSSRIVIQDTVTQDPHPPLYFLLLHFFGIAAGWSQFSLRFFSVGAAMLAVALAFIVARRLFGRGAGFIAALLFGMSPLYLWYAREMRSYALLVALTLLSLYLTLRLLGQAPNRRLESAALWLGYALCALAIVSTHYLGFFPVLFEAAVLLAGAVWRRRWWLTTILVALAVLALPVAVVALRRFLGPPDAGFYPVALGTILADLLHNTLFGLTVDRAGAFPFEVAWLAIWAVGVLSPLAIRRPRRQALLASAFAATYLAFVTVVFYLASSLHPIYMGVRHIIFVTPAIYLSVAAGLAVLLRRRRVLGAAALAAVVAVYGVGTWSYHFDPAYRKDDLRTLVQTIQRRAGPRDVVLLSEANLSLTFDYYDERGLGWTALPRQPGPVGSQTIDHLRALLPRYDNVWYVYGPYGVYDDPDNVVIRWVESNLLKLEDHIFHGHDGTVAAARYATGSPIQDVTPLPRHVVDAVVGGPLRLVGFETVPGRIRRSGEPLHVVLTWLVQGSVRQPIRTTIRLVDDAGRIWAEGDDIPFGWQLPPSEWPAGKSVRQDQIVELPLALPPGTYRLELQVADAATRQPLYRLDQLGQPRGETVGLGALQIESPAIWRPSLARIVDQRVELRWDGVLELVGYTMPPETTVPQGDPISFITLLRAVQPLRGDYRLRVDLVDAGGASGASALLPVGSTEHPPARWQAGDALLGRHVFRVPAQTPPGVYRVQLSLVAGDDPTPRPGRRGLWPIPQSTATLGTVQVAARPRIFDPPAVSHPIEARFGDSADLIGYDLSVQRDGGRRVLRFTLYWQARSRPDRTLWTTLQALAPGPRVVVQTDGPPGRDGRSTLAWLPGEVIADDRQLVLDETMPADLTLIVALYDDDGRRVPVTQGGRSADHAVLPVNLGDLR